MDASTFFNSFLNDEAAFIQYIAWIYIIMAFVVLGTSIFVRTPYGRYGSTSWGPLINAKLAWFLQELPALCVPLFLMLSSDATTKHYIPNKIILFGLTLHYFQRTLIYPFLIRGGKPTPLFPFLCAVVFTTFNGYMQARYLTKYAYYPERWERSTLFILGMLIFFTGMAINIHSDHILRTLRKPGETGYKIPHGGMFEFVSGANFFGEALEWTGYFIASQSLVAAAFCVACWFNIGPRAVHHHRWYHEKFDDYPKQRKALIPFIF